MKQFVTVLLICSAVAALSPELSASSRTIPDVALQMQHLDYYVQAGGFHTVSADNGWSITTRVYKPRSTQPTNFSESFGPDDHRMMVSFEEEETACAVGKVVRTTRGICSEHELERMHLTVEKKIFVGSINLLINLTA